MKFAQLSDLTRHIYYRIVGVNTDVPRSPGDQLSGDNGGERTEKGDTDYVAHEDIDLHAQP